MAGCAGRQGRGNPLPLSHVFRVYKFLWPARSASCNAIKVSPASDTPPRLPPLTPSLLILFFSSFLLSFFSRFSCALLPARKANRCAPVNDSPGTFILTRKIATFRATLGKAVCPRYHARFPFPLHCPETTHTSGHLSFVCCVDDDFLSVLNLIFISPTVVARYGFLWPSQVKSGASPSPLLPAPSTSSCLLI